MMEGDENTDTNLYVKGLPSDFNETQVMALFQEHGIVISARYMPPPAGRSDSTALVRMATLQEAHNAIAALNGAVLGGPAVGAMMVRYHGPPSAPPSDNLYVKGLPTSITDEAVRIAFSACGSVQSLRLMPPRPPAEDCTALVRMSSVDEATAAIQALNGTMAPGAAQSQLLVRFANTPRVKEDKVYHHTNQQPQQQRNDQWHTPPQPPQPPGAMTQAMRVPPRPTMPAPAPYQPVTDHASWSPAGNSLTLEVRYQGPRSAPPSDNLYVKGLLPTHNTQDLARIFGVCGEVVSTRIMPSATDATAMVRMASVEQATAAIAQLNGRPIEMETGFAAQQAEMSFAGYQAEAEMSYAAQETPWDTWTTETGTSTQTTLIVRYHGTANAPPSDNLYVKGLPRHITQEGVREIFQSCGNVHSLRLMPGERDAAALVRMTSVEEATLAISLMHNVPLDLGNNAAPPMPTVAPPMPPGPPPMSLPRVRPSSSSPRVVPPPVARAPVMPPAEAFVRPVQQPAAMGLLVRYHGAKNAPPSDNLYVKGLPAGSSETEVRGLFETYGTVVSVRLMPGAADATALVRMGSVEEAAAAIEFLNGFHASVPVMQEAEAFVRPAQQPAATGLVVRYHGAKNAPPSDNLYVKGLPAGSSETEVRALFETYGYIVSIRLMPGAADATALVRMGSVEEATAAIESLNDVHDSVPGKAVGVRWANGVRASPY